jgi:hypothetical protein
MRPRFASLLAASAIAASYCACSTSSADGLADEDGGAAVADAEADSRPDAATASQTCELKGESCEGDACCLKSPMKGALADFDAGCLHRSTPLGCDPVCRFYPALEDCVVRTVDGGPEEIYLTPVVYALDALGPSFSRCSEEQIRQLVGLPEKPACP